MITATATGQKKAKDSQFGQGMLYAIKCNIEWDGRTLQDAEAISMSINGCALEAVTTDQAYAVPREIHRTSKSVEVEPHDGYCMTCERPSSLRQCIGCRERRAEGYRPKYQSII